MIESMTVTGCRLVFLERMSGPSTCASSWLATVNTTTASTAAHGLTVNPSSTAGTTPRMGPR